MIDLDTVSVLKSFASFHKVVSKDEIRLALREVTDRYDPDVEEYVDAVWAVLTK